MKFLAVTSAENGQTVYIPLKRVNNIRYPAANGKDGNCTTLITGENNGVCANLKLYIEQQITKKENKS